MLISSFKKLWVLLFGSPKFQPGETANLMTHCGRVYMHFVWTDYYRWVGLCRLGYRHKQGVLQLGVHFNPGMPEILFQTFLAMGGPDSDVKFIPVSAESNATEVEVQNKFQEAIDSEDLEPEREWHYTTAVRNREDLDSVGDWVADLEQFLLEKDEDEVYGGRLSESECIFVDETLNELAESLPACPSSN